MFFTFMKNLFKRKPTYVADIKNMHFISSYVKGDIETIVHGDNNCEIEIVINRKAGQARIVSDKDIDISDDDVAWLMEKYL